VAILISGVVSVTLTPMLCSRFLRPLELQRRGVFYRVTERFFDGMLRSYNRSLWWVLHHRPVMMTVFILVFGATAYLFTVVPKGFIPDADNDQLSVTTEAAQGTSYLQMVDYTRKVADVISKDPNVVSFMTSVGGGFSSSMNYGRMMLLLKPRRQRALTVNEVMDELRPKVSGFPGVRVFMTVPPSIRIGGRMSKSLYEITVQSPDNDELYQQAAKLEREVAKLPGVQDVNSDLQIKNPNVNVQIDRDKAASMQLNATDIESSLYNAYGPAWVSTIYGNMNQYHVLMEILPEYQEHADSLSLIYFKSGDGHLIPLSNVVKLVQTLARKRLTIPANSPRLRCRST
jgi:HAE1 family hydrophobic/amphiphilic exporter-1